MVANLDSEVREDSAYFRHTNKCPQSHRCNGRRPELHVLKGHTSEWASDSVRMASRTVFPASSPLKWPQTRPSRQDVWLAEEGLTFSCCLSPPEQHAVQELTKAAMSGVGIDGEVLSYLELAQVCNNLLFTF